MIAFLPWLFAALMGVAQAAPGDAGSGLRAVKPGTKHAKGVKRRTVEEWRRQQREERAAAAREKAAKAEAAKAAPPEEPKPPTDEQSQAAAELSKTKKAKAKRKAREKANDPASQSLLKRYQQELYGLLALLCLWLITRIYGQTSAKNVRQPPPRPSPVTEEELGRILFGVGRSNDVDTYRSLFLNGAEATQVLGHENTERYLSDRSLPALELACEQFSDQLPAGTSYIKTALSPTHQCVLHIADATGSAVIIEVGTVARVGAILRLVAPAVKPQQVPLSMEDLATEVIRRP